MAIRVGSAVLLIVSSIVLARVLGIEAYGAYSFALAVVAVLQLPATAGAYTLVLRETASGIGRLDFAAVKGLWKWSMRFVGKFSLGTVLLAAAALLVSGQVADWDRREVLFLAVLAVLAVPVVSCMKLLSARLRGLGFIISSQVPEQLVQPGMLVVLVVICSVSRGSIDSSTAILLYLAAAVCGLAMLMQLFRRTRPAQIADPAADMGKIASWHRTLIPLTMLSGLQIVNSQAGLVFMGGTGNVPAVAELKLATSMTIAGTFGAQVVSFGVQNFPNA